MQSFCDWATRAWGSWSKAAPCVQKQFQETGSKYVRDPSCPDPWTVYWKDVLDFKLFFTVQGIHLASTDDTFYAEILMGYDFISWQNKTIELECFNDMDESENEANVALDLENR